MTVAFNLISQRRVRLATLSAWSRGLQEMGRFVPPEADPPLAGKPGDPTGRFFNSI
jgi:hypothetical protein